MQKWRILLINLLINFIKYHLGKIGGLKARTTKVILPDRQRIYDGNAD